MSDAQGVMSLAFWKMNQYGILGVFKLSFYWH